jgi:hypothetical protein
MTRQNDAAYDSNFEIDELVAAFRLHQRRERRGIVERDAGRAALHRLPQPSGGRKGRRRPGRDRGGADFTALGAASRQRPAEHRSLPIQFRHCRGHATLNPSVEPSIMYLSQLVHTAWENING